MFISLSALSLCDEKYYIRFRRILQVFFEKIFGTVFRARFGRQPISRPCDRRRLRLQPKRRCKITIISFSRSICRGGLAAFIGVTGKPYPSCLSCHSHPIRPFRAPSPRGEGFDTRIPSSKKGGEAATRALNPEPNESKVKRSCEEMRIHFFTAPFLSLTSDPLPCRRP